MTENSERKLIGVLKTKIQKINLDYEAENLDFALFDNSLLKEREFQFYYKRIQSELLPILYDLYKLNSILTEEFIKINIQENFIEQITKEVRNYKDRSLLKVWQDDLLKEQKVYYDAYLKEIQKIYKEVQSFQNENANFFTNSLNQLNDILEDKDNFDNVFNIQNILERETKIKLNEKIADAKMEKYIVPYMERNKTKFCLLLKNSFELGFGTLILLKERDLQFALCNHEFNEQAFLYLTNIIANLKEEETENKGSMPVFKMFLFKYFYNKFNPDDFTQKGQLSLRVFKYIFLEANVKDEVMSLFKK